MISGFQRRSWNAPCPGTLDKRDMRRAEMLNRRAAAALTTPGKQA